MSRKRRVVPQATWDKVLQTLASSPAHKLEEAMDLLGELMEALRSASTLLEEGGTQASVDEAARVIRAAIAKAEGK